jgi:hypothetical protein
MKATTREDYLRPSFLEFRSHLLHEFANRPSGGQPGEGLGERFVAHLRKERKQTNRKMFQEQRKEAKKRAEMRDKARIKRGLFGPSVKKAMNLNASLVQPPTALRTEDGGISTEPEVIKEGTRHYYSQLYQKPPTPECPKPWMDTEEVQQIRRRCNKDPYLWPRRMELQDLDALLKSGNTAPSPGPNGWEKWIVALLPAT